MTELDFDELDRSINSAMSSETKTVDNSNSEAPAPAARPSLAIRRRGQFMDMVHPSSDMTRSSERPVSRRANEIKPINMTQPPVSSENIQNAPTSSPDSALSVAPEDQAAPSESTDFHFDMENTNAASATDVQTEQTSAPEKFDPITPPEINPSPAVAPMENPENADANSDATAPDDEPPVDDEDDDIAEIAASIEPVDTSEVPISPFLPDAKPEKRPLDALQSASVPTLQQMNELSVTLQDQLDVLQPDADESAEPKDDEPKVSEPIVDLPADKDQEESPASAPENFAVSHQEMEAALKEPRTEATSGPTSIPQQYTENPTEQQPSGAIYDTEQYHTAVNDAPKPKKAKKAFYWVIWVVVFLFVGVAAGAGYFFLTMR